MSIKRTCCVYWENTASFVKRFYFELLKQQRTEKGICNLLYKHCFAGFSVFVVGVADVDYNELANIASKPSERHVFIVDDFESFEKIEDNLITFVCETATSSKSQSKWIHNLTCFGRYYLVDNCLCYMGSSLCINRFQGDHLGIWWIIVPIEIVLNVCLSEVHF